MAERYLTVDDSLVPVGSQLSAKAIYRVKSSADSPSPGPTPAGGVYVPSILSAECSSDRAVILIGGNGNAASATSTVYRAYYTNESLSQDPNAREMLAEVVYNNQTRYTWIRKADEAYMTGVPHIILVLEGDSINLWEIAFKLPRPDIIRIVYTESTIIDNVPPGMSVDIRGNAVRDDIGLCCSQDRVFVGRYGVANCIASVLSVNPTDGKVDTIRLLTKYEQGQSPGPTPVTNDCPFLEGGATNDCHYAAVRLSGFTEDLYDVFFCDRTDASASAWKPATHINEVTVDGGWKYTEYLFSPGYGSNQIFTDDANAKIVSKSDSSKIWVVPLPLSKLTEPVCYIPEDFLIKDTPVGDSIDITETANPEIINRILRKTAKTRVLMLCGDASGKSILYFCESVWWDNGLCGSFLVLYNGFLIPDPPEPVQLPPYTMNISANNYLLDFTHNNADVSVTRLSGLEVYYCNAKQVTTKDSTFPQAHKMTMPTVWGNYQYCHWGYTEGAQYVRDPVLIIKAPGFPVSWIPLKRYGIVRQTAIVCSGINNLIKTWTPGKEQGFIALPAGSEWQVGDTVMLVPSWSNWTAAVFPFRIYSVRDGQTDMVSGFMGTPVKVGNWNYLPSTQIISNWFSFTTSYGENVKLAMYSPQVVMNLQFTAKANVAVSSLGEIYCTFASAPFSFSRDLHENQPVMLSAVARYPDNTYHTVFFDAIWDLNPSSFTLTLQFKGTTHSSAQIQNNTIVSPNWVFARDKWAEDYYSGS